MQFIEIVVVADLVHTGSIARITPCRRCGACTPCIIPARRWTGWRARACI
jgi:hypothetical protein